MSAGMRVSPIAPVGSLLKGAPLAKSPKREHPKKKTKRKAKPGLDAAHLAAVRRCPCLSCDADPAGEAAHLRITAVGKPIAGTGNKPDDKWALPLCPECHTRGPKAQHRVGEVAFWSTLGLDPLVIAERLHRASPDVPAMRSIIFAERERRK